MEGSSSLPSSDDLPIISDSITDKDMATSNFSQVVFPDIPDTYPPKQDIRVTCIINEEVTTSSRDWIGLFKVGWTTPRDYLTFVWCPSASNNISAVTFTAYYLPTDDSEFYQFCYVTKQGLVKGASTPFQFRDKNENSDLVEVEDENGMIVLKTKSAALQDSLEKVSHRKDELESELASLNEEKTKVEKSLEEIKRDLKITTEDLLMEKEKNKDAQDKLKDLREKFENTKTSLASAKLKITEIEGLLNITKEDKKTLEYGIQCVKDEMSALESKHADQITDLTQQVDEKAQELCKAEVRVVEMTNKIKELQMKHESFQKSNTELKQSTAESLNQLISARDAAIAKALRYKEEKELFQKQFQESEVSRNDLSTTVKSLTDDLEIKTSKLSQTYDKLAAQTEKINLLDTEIKNIKLRETKQMRSMEKGMSLMEDKLNASEACKRLISNELSEARESRDKLLSELNVLKREKEEIQKKLSMLKNEKKISDSVLMELRETANTNQEHIKKLEQSKRSDKKANEKAQRELKKQISVLQKQLEESDAAIALQKSAQDENESAATQTDEKEDKDMNLLFTVDDESVIDDLKSQIEDLRTRLSMGAAAYTEKYIECHKLEKKLKKIQATTKSPIIREQATAMLESTATSDSQQEEGTRIHSDTQKKSKPSNKKRSRGGKKSPQAVVTPPVVPEQKGGMLSKLEQLFLAIADPDAEEQEQAQQLQDKLKDLERNVQFQHSKYKKYKLLFQDEKQKHTSKVSELEKQIADLQEQVEAGKSRSLSLENENKALHAQVDEFVHASNDANIIKTKNKPIELISSDDIPTANSVIIPPQKYGNPYVKDNAKKSDSESDSSLEFVGVPTSFLSLCPKNISSDDSDSMEITRPPTDAASNSATVTNQPVRSPPLIEEIPNSKFEVVRRTSGGARHRAKKRSSKGHKSYA